MALLDLLGLDPHEVSPSFSPHVGARRLMAAVVVQAVQDAHTRPALTPAELMEAREATARRALKRHGAVGKTAWANANRELEKVRARLAAAKRFGLENVALTNDQCTACDFLLGGGTLDFYLELLDIDPGAFRARVMDGCGALLGWAPTTHVKSRREWFDINLLRWRRLRSLPSAVAAIAIAPEEAA